MNILKILMNETDDNNQNNNNKLGNKSLYNTIKKFDIHDDSAPYSFSRTKKTFVNTTLYFIAIAMFSQYIILMI
jgi:hypothetical protein